jgi:hypothetical protein
MRVPRPKSEPYRVSVSKKSSEPRPTECTDSHERAVRDESTANQEREPMEENYRIGRASRKLRICTVKSERAVVMERTEVTERAVIKERTDTS